MYPFERFTDSAKGVMTLAQQEADRRHHPFLGTEHLLLGLMRQEDGLAHAALMSLGLDLSVVRGTIDRLLRPKGQTHTGATIPTSRIKRVFALAFEDASRQNSQLVGTGNLLCALLTEEEGIAAHLLLDRGATVDRVKAEIQRLRDSGVLESVRVVGPVATHKYSHLDVQNVDGRMIGIDVIFPPDYSDEKCSEVGSNILKAIRGDRS